MDLFVAATTSDPFKFNRVSFVSWACGDTTRRTLAENAMDARRFDAITKTLWTVGTRRQASRAALAAAIGLIAPPRRSGSAERQKSCRKGARRCGTNCCPKGSACCKKKCVNLSNDLRNCGRCGFDCRSVSPNTRCVNGTCPCVPGFVSCGDPGAPSGATCTKLGTVKHCRRCGDTCSGDPCETVTCDLANGCSSEQKGNGASCGASRYCHAETCVDYGILSTIKLPWCGEDREPRTLVQDWKNDHAAGDIGAIGFALDFGRSAQGESVLRTFILAPMAGILRRDPYGADSSGFGNHVRIDHDSGWQVILAHLDETSFVGHNSEVNLGDVIGWLGNSGNSKAPHVHVELRFDDNEPTGLFGNTANDLALFGYKRNDFTFGNGKTFRSRQRTCND